MQAEKGLLVRLWRKKHKHLATFKLSWLFNNCNLRASLGKALHCFKSYFGMSHFSTAETDRNLNLIAVLNKLKGVVKLCVKIVSVDVKRKSDFLNVNNMLIFSGLLFPF